MRGIRLAGRLYGLLIRLDDRLGKEQAQLLHHFIEVGLLAGIPADVRPVSAENPVTLCDLGILAARAAEPVPAENLDVCAWSRWLPTPGRRALLQRPVRAMLVVADRCTPRGPAAGAVRRLSASGPGTRGGHWRSTFRRSRSPEAPGPVF